MTCTILLFFLSLSRNQNSRTNASVIQWSSDLSIFSMAFFFFFFFFLGSWNSCDSFKVKVTNWTPTTVPAQKNNAYCALRTVHAEIYWNPRHSTTFHGIPRPPQLLHTNLHPTPWLHMRSTGNEPDRVRRPMKQNQIHLKLQSAVSTL